MFGLPRGGNGKPCASISCRNAFTSSSLVSLASTTHFVLVPEVRSSSFSTGVNECEVNPNPKLITSRRLMDLFRPTPKNEVRRRSSDDGERTSVRHRTDLTARRVPKLANNRQTRRNKKPK